MATNRPKVLIVEDDETNLIYLQLVLKDLNIELLKAVNGQAAVETFEQNQDIELILMDIRLPGMDGYEATSMIRKMNKDVVIIAQTAYAFSSDKDKAIESGCNDYVSKPIRREELLKKINHYLDLSV
ncbi:CAI-1 autoinducer sensor kinase/phosphatase CqsS [bioreactor metagenome]|uniref:CAI-1 autoinducer sensor kinase/phosphatase CqsS n=1 Tax=bioreactor metagenome TaxID=1076179 RepID=A0A645BAF5_9ZZZZ